jgi:hypothetical protein
MRSVILICIVDMNDDSIKYDEPRLYGNRETDLSTKTEHC